MLNAYIERSALADSNEALAPSTIQGVWSQLPYNLQVVPPSDTEDLHRFLPFKIHQMKYCMQTV